MCVPEDPQVTVLRAEVEVWKERAKSAELQLRERDALYESQAAQSRKDYSILSGLKDQAVKELEESNRLNGEYLEHLEMAWGVIANAGPDGCLGNWKKMEPKWVEVAERWRDKWLGFLRQRMEKRKSVRERAEELGIDVSKIKPQNPHPPGPYPEEGGLVR